MKAYKVVCRSNSKEFEPCTSLALQRIRYCIGKETIKEETEYGPFALFETEEQARNFARGFTYPVSILLCEYEPSNETAVWKKNPPSFVKGWKGYYAQSNGITQKCLDECPNGTVLADVVIPLELIADGI